ncbi:MAG: type II toxin-antitoxin system RelE/ParE family toxin [Hyphomicrobiales bacterium]|nr:type II toxin-antitoxin system RelE/ParE family toxin [Hyphomicrobiales bacterium]
MVEVRTTEIYDKWFAKLRDRKAKATIDIRVQRLSKGHVGDAEPVGNGVSELRIHYGPGYRVYFVRSGKSLVILLCGGDKNSQARDIRTAKALASHLE